MLQKNKFLDFNEKRMNDPHVVGHWKNWSKLAESESHKPSGLPLGEVILEDYEYANKG
ncbi:hypothetical protein KUV50_04370 [Membranicola marinus]|uniref:DUF5000 domain-containing protein n=1 Tax=Membranihabitans marinus TaxID=1227546 RepID=A0A953LC40_9BACT|nr:DUF5000 domain-containing lipoprotein [Membranihabitans marinus]MBY5957359.1 hypothetical protein [Membranihabitans marinus]